MKHSFCEDWEFTRHWTEAFGKGLPVPKQQAVRLPHTCREVPLHYASPADYEMVCGYRKRFRVPPVQAAPSVVPPVVQPQSVPAAAPDDVPPPIDDDPPFLQPELKPAPQQAPAPVPPAPAAPAPRKAEPPRQAGPLEPFAFWPAVLADLEENDAMLISFLRGTRAYCDGKRVLFECSDAFRDYIRNNREVSKRLKETIYRVSRTKYSIGPYEEPKTDDTTAAVSLDETLHTMQALGVDLKIVDK